MTEAHKGLQLLVDSFAGSEDPDERDELLQDIIAHPSPQALGFLRLVANNPSEDRYLRCDAICALFSRTFGEEQTEAVLLLLANPYDAYEYCSACNAIGAARFAAAVPIVMAHFDGPLEEACLDATIDALECIGETGAEKALIAWLDAQGVQADEARTLLVIGAIERLRPAGAETSLRAFGARVPGPLAAVAFDAAEAVARPREDDTADEE